MKILKKSSILLCNLLMFSSCSLIYNSTESTSSTQNSDVSTNIIQESKVNIHIVQYDLQHFYSQEGLGFWGYDRILWDIKVEFDYNYFLTYKEAENIMNRCNQYVPPLNGDGYYFFTELYVKKELKISESGVEYLEFSERFLDCYLTQDLELYYGIWG